MIIDKCIPKHRNLHVETIVSALSDSLICIIDYIFSEGMLTSRYMQSMATEAQRQNLRAFQGNNPNELCLYDEIASLLYSHSDLPRRNADYGNLGELNKYRIPIAFTLQLMLTF